MFSIRNLLIIIATVTSMVLVIGTLIIWTSHDSLHQMDLSKDRAIKAMLIFKDVRYHVIQIQQFLTDASAVGEENFDEARQHTKLVHDKLEELKGILPDIHEAIDQAEGDVDVLNKVGERMVVLYVHQGREVGNTLMKGKGGFDEISRRLTDLLDKLALGLEKQVQDATALQAKTASFATFSSVIITSIAVFLTIFSSIWQYRRLMYSLGGEPSYASSIIKRVAQGDLSLKIGIKPIGERQSLLTYMRSMVDQLHGHMREIERITKQIGQSSYQISEISHEIAASSAAEQSRSADVKQATSDLHTISNQVKQLATVVHDRSIQNQTVAQKASAAVRENIEQMQETVQEVQYAEEKILLLSRASSRIQEITSTIANITEHTNLLALNAAIEAARAGEHGRGFAIVAGEVRKLAKHASDATTEIYQITHQLADLIRHNQEIMEKIVSSTQRGMETAKNTQDVICEITKDIEENNAISVQITTVAGEQVQKLTILNAQLEELFHTLRTSGAKVHATKIISGDLHHVTQDLYNMLQYFQFDRSWTFSPAANEHRQSPRANNHLLVRVMTPQGQYDSVTADFSMNGMRIRMPNLFVCEDHEHVDLEILTPHEDLKEYQHQDPLRVRGEIMWKRLENDQYFYGVKFIELSSLQKQKLDECFQYFNQSSSYVEPS